MHNVQIIENVLEKYPIEVLRIFSKHGIVKNPTVATVLQAIDAFGEPFLFDIFELHYKEVSFLGINWFKKKPEPASTTDKAAGTQEEKKEKKSLWEAFKSVFSKTSEKLDKASQILAQTQGVVNQGNQIVNPAKDPAPVKKDNTILYMAIAVGVLLAIATLIYFSKK